MRSESDLLLGENSLSVGTIGISEVLRVGFEVVDGLVNVRTPIHLGKSTIAHHANSGLGKASSEIPVSDDDKGVAGD